MDYHEQSPVETVCSADGDAPKDQLAMTSHAKYAKEVTLRTLPISTILQDRLAAIHASHTENHGEHDEDAAFFAGDLGEVVRQFAKFRKLLPRVVPHYAVKCNPDDMIVKTLVDLGAGFDCASKVRF
jgi:ornithine decarboxylase